MKRAVLISGKFWTSSKRTRIQDFLRRYGDAVRFYIARLWAEIPTKYQNFGDNRLSARLKTAALRQAQGIIASTQASANATGSKATCPDFRGVGATLDAKNVGIRLDIGTGEFDLFVDLRVLHNLWLVLPCKATERLRYWLSKPGATLVQGLTITADRIVLWVNIPDPTQLAYGSELGIDIGVNKILTTSEGQKIGVEYRELGRKVRRKQPGSKARLMAHRERDQFFRRCVNKLPWHRLGAIAIEDLTGMKVGKKRGRGKKFRKMLAPWSYRQVVIQVELKAQENGVYLVLVDPRGTSRLCPACGTEHVLNRRDEVFLCHTCNHAGDADVVAAGNILSRARTLPAWSRQDLAVGESR